MLSLSPYDARVEADICLLEIQGLEDPEDEAMEWHEANCPERKAYLERERRRR